MWEKIVLPIECMLKRETAELRRTQEPIHFFWKAYKKLKNKDVHQNILKISKTGIKSNAILFIFLTT